MLLKVFTVGKFSVSDFMYKMEYMVFYNFLIQGVIYVISSIKFHRLKLSEKMYRYNAQSGYSEVNSLVSSPVLTQQGQIHKFP